MPGAATAKSGEYQPKGMMMFAHQVIDDCETLEGKNLTGGQHSWLPDYIRRAQKFHLKSVKFLTESFSSLEDREFVEYLRCYARLPYDLCWVDFIDDFSLDKPIKAGILVEETIFPTLKESLPGFNAFMFHKYRIWTPFFRVFYGVLSPGISNEEEDFIFSIPWQFQAPPVPQSIDKTWEMIGSHYSLILYYLMFFLACKNIYAENIEAPAPLNRKRQKRGKSELFDYKILKIKNASLALKTSEQNYCLSQKKRYHFCRGHIKHYSQARPLFGKYSGLWFWAPHIRGNKGGFVFKDYIV